MALPSWFTWLSQKTPLVMINVWSCLGSLLLLHTRVSASGIPSFISAGQDQDACVLAWSHRFPKSLLLASYGVVSSLLISYQQMYCIKKQNNTEATYSLHSNSNMLDRVYLSWSATFFTAYLMTTGCFFLLDDNWITESAGSWAFMHSFSKIQWEAVSFNCNP